MEAGSNRAAKLGQNLNSVKTLRNIKFEKHQYPKNENHSELFNNLLEDLKNPNKQISKVSNPIKELESETLNGTMRLIENFIK